MFNEEEYKQEIETATKVMSFVGQGRINMLLPNSYWHSTITNIIQLTDNFHYGNMGKKIVIKYNLILTIYAILCFTFSSYAWYINLIFVIVALFIANKFRNQELKKCIQEVALDNPYGFRDAWNKKLFALQIESTEKIYMSGNDELIEIINDLDRS